MRVENVLKGHGVGGGEKFEELISDIALVSKNRMQNGNVASIYNDAGEHIYAAVGSNVFKIKKSNLSIVAKSASHTAIIRDMAFDGSYFYVGVNNSNKLWQIETESLTKISEITLPFAGVSAILYANGYLYISSYENSNRKTIKMDASNFTVVAENSSYGNEIVDSMVYINDFLYAIVINQGIKKIDTETMAVVSEEILARRALSTDGKCLYATTLANTIIKVNAENLNKVAESSSYGNTVQVSFSDGRYLYIGGDIIEAIYKIDTSNMEKVAESIGYGNTVLSGVSDDRYIYIGGHTLGEVWKLISVFHVKK